MGQLPPRNHSPSTGTRSNGAAAMLVSNVIRCYLQRVVAEFPWLMHGRSVDATRRDGAMAGDLIIYVFRRNEW
jgi:hypothetical protein